MSMKKRLISACAGVLAVGALSAAANAALTIDLRTEGGAKSVELKPADLNKPITLNVYAQVTGALTGTGKFETFASVQGAFVSTGSTLGKIDAAGDLDGMTYSFVVAGKDPFNGAGATTGASMDIDGDGDLDLGAKTGSTTNNDWVVFRTDLKNYGAKSGQGSAIANGTEFLVGAITFTPSQLGGNTLINFTPRTDETGAYTTDSGLWTEDGVLAASVRNGSTGSFVTNGFQIIVPEPASLSVLGLGGALLLGRRNRK
jgi:hypothetical protein